MVLPGARKTASEPSKPREGGSAPHASEKGTESYGVEQGRALWLDASRELTRCVVDALFGWWPRHWRPRGVRLALGGWVGMLREEVLCGPQSSPSHLNVPGRFSAFDCCT